MSASSAAATAAASVLSLPPPQPVAPPLPPFSSSCRIPLPFINKDGEYQSAEAVFKSDPTSASSAASSSSFSSNRTYLNLEYPGYVVNVEKALEKVKGEESLRKVISTPDSLLKLYYRPGCSSSHPLYGEVNRRMLTHPVAPSHTTTARRNDAALGTGTIAATEHAFEFVVKVTRRRRRGERKSRITTEYLGQLTHAVTFPGLCDFQLTTAEPREIELDLPQLWPASGTSAAPPTPAQQYANLLRESKYSKNQPGEYIIAPSLFSRYDYAREYEFANHDNSNAAVKAAAASANANASGRMSSSARMILGESNSNNNDATMSDVEEEKTSLAGTPKVKPLPSPTSATTSTAKKPRSSGTKRPREKSTPRPTQPVKEAPDLEGLVEEEAEDDEMDEGDGEDDTVSLAGSVEKKKSGKGGKEGEEKRPSRKPRRFFVKFEDDVIAPLGPDPGSEFATPAFQARQLVKRLRGLFEQRPIWSSDALVLRLAADLSPTEALELTRQDMLHQLVAVSYRFSGGAWRNMWIRYGYDPRKLELARDASMYQVVDYRINTKLFNELNAQATAAAASTAVPSSRPMKPGSAAANPLVTIAVQAVSAGIELHFSRLPARMHTSYQICELNEEIQQIARDAELTSKAEKETGWFDVPTLTKIRAIMHQKMIVWCAERGMTPENSDLTTLTSPASTKKRNKQRQTLGRAFAAERNRVKGLMAVRKPRKKQKKGEESKTDNISTTISEGAIHAAASAASAASAANELHQGGSSGPAAAQMNYKMEDIEDDEDDNGGEDEEYEEGGEEED